MKMNRVNRTVILTLCPCHHGDLRSLAMGAINHSNQVGDPFSPGVASLAFRFLHRTGREASVVAL